MKQVIEVFEWGVEGEFAQRFFISEKPIEQVFAELVKESYTFNARYSNDNRLSYLDGIEMISQKLQQKGFKEVEVNMHDSYIEHLNKYILVTTESDMVQLELLKQTKELCGTGKIFSRNIKIVSDKGGENE